FGRAIGDRGSQLVTCGALLLSAVLGIFLFRDILASDEVRVIPLASWIIAGGVDVNWALRLDTLSGVMIVVVTVVSSMVHVYSIGYMHGDPSIPRFMSYLSLFTFFMLALVTSDNFVQLFFGWEGVGLMSYLLVGFWYDRPSANAAAIKAFLVNRVGDFGLSPVRLAASSATCSPPPASRPTAPQSSTFSRMPSSRGCCSCAADRSSMRWAVSRTCAGWAASGARRRSLM